MPAYVVAIIEIHDPDRYEAEYMSGVAATVERHGGRALAVADAISLKEGEWPGGRTVVLEFPDAAAAEAWYSDADYQPLLAVRKQISDGILGIVEGLA